MARSSLKLVTGPTSELVTLAELKLAARLDGVDEDPLLQTYIIAARQAAEEWTRRSFLTQSWRFTLDQITGRAYDLPEGVHDMAITELYGGLPSVITLPRGPVIAITSITNYDLDDASSVFSSTNYTLDADGARVMLTYGAQWPSNLRARASTAILYTAGYGSTVNEVPQAIRSAIMMHAQRMYDERIICEMPTSCQRLLSPYRVMDGLSG